MKKSPIKSPSNQQKHQPKSVSKGKEKQNVQLSAKKQQKQKSPHRLSKTPAKSPSQKKQQSKFEIQGLKRNTLFPIPQIVDSKDDGKFNAFKQSLVFTKEQKIIQKTKEDHQNNQRSPSFQRSSIKMSEKRYNVSLASMSSNRQPNTLTLTKSKKSLAKPSTSPVKPKAQFQTDQQIQQWLATNLNKINNDSIKKINEEYKQLIQQPLKFQQQLSNTSNPIQRCLVHNTPYSLYCTIDRQLLCVSCIYAQKTHKSHQILPLAKSQKQMKEDAQGFRNRIDTTLVQSQNLIRQSSLNLIKIQKQYPVLLKKIEQYYVRIHDLIDQRKVEQLEYVQSLREQYKRELKVINSLLNKINNVFIDKLKQIQRTSKAINKQVYFAKNLYQPNVSQQFIQTDTSQLLLHSTIKNRCNYEILARYCKILNKNSDQLFDQRRSFDVNLQNFDQVLNLIRYKLTMVVPVMKKEDGKKAWIVQLLGQDGAKDVGTGKVNQKGQKINRENKNGNKNNYDDRMSPNKVNQQKSNMHKKGFSTSPQVPKGISRRFL